MIVWFAVREMLRNHRRLGVAITAVLVGILAGEPSERTRATASDDLGEATSRQLRSSAEVKTPFEFPPRMPLTVRAGEPQRPSDRAAEEPTVELKIEFVAETLESDAAVVTSVQQEQNQEQNQRICGCLRCTSAATPEERTGYPHRISKYARPSVSSHYGGYFFGGGSARRNFGRVFGGTETRNRNEGTWGWDYTGPLSLRRVALKWWHGRRQQAGAGSYATERMGGRRHSSDHTSDHTSDHSSDH